MTLTSTTSSVEYTADGVTTAFAFPALFFEDSDLVVTVISDDGSSDEKALTTDYTVSGAGTAGGGTVTFNSAPANGKTVRIDRWVPFQQNTDLADNDPFPADTIETQLDKIVAQVQQLAGRTGGADFDIGLKDAMHLSSSDADAWDAENHRILNLEDPAADGEAATKSYVDSAVSTGQASLQSIDGVRNDGGDVDLVAGSGMTITPDNSANTITITSQRDAAKLRGKSLASGVDTPADKDVLRWNNGNSEWELKSSDDALWNALKFRGKQLASAVSTPSDGQVLEFNSTSGEWELGSKSGSAVTGVASVDGVSNDGGDIDLVESGGVTITPDDAANTITFATETTAASTIDGVSNPGGDIDLVGGTGVTVTPDNANDKITLAADNSSNIWNANQVQGRSVQDAAPSDNDVLQWSNSNSRWEPTALSDSGNGFSQWVVYDPVNDSVLARSESGITVTKNGSGDYTINWASAFGSANYFYSLDSEHRTAGFEPNTYIHNGGQTTTSLRVRVSLKQQGDVRDFFDPAKICVGALE